MARKESLKTAALSEFYLREVDRKKRQIPLFLSQESKKKRGKRRERFLLSRILLNRGYSSESCRGTLRTETCTLISLLGIPGSPPISGECCSKVNLGIGVLQA